MFVNASVAFRERWHTTRVRMKRTSKQDGGAVSTTLDTSCAGQSLGEHSTIGRVISMSRYKIDKIVDPIGK